jgi:hypothetical protein
MSNNTSLYANNKNPSKSIKNTGYKNEDKALNTVKIIKHLDKIKQMQIILTMYYRAKYHPHKTLDMIKAQKIFKKWLIKNGYKKSIK